MWLCYMNVINDSLNNYICRFFLFKCKLEVKGYVGYFHYSRDSLCYDSFNNLPYYV